MCEPMLSLILHDNCWTGFWNSRFQHILRAYFPVIYPNVHDAWTIVLLGKLDHHLYYPVETFEQ